MNIHPETYLADNIIIVENVETEKNVSIWYGSVIRGDEGKIYIGENSVIEDNCVLHGNIHIAENCIIGHGAIIHGCTLERNVLIGMGAIVMDGSLIKEGSVIAAGALVPKNTIVESGSIYMGVPARFVRKTNPENEEYIRKGIEEYHRLALFQLHPYKQ